jgi:hypothetical protein
MPGASWRSRATKRTRDSLKFASHFSALQAEKQSPLSNLAIALFSVFFQATGRFSIQQHKPSGILGISITLKVLDYWLLDWYYLNLNFLGIKQSEK